MKQSRLLNLILDCWLLLSLPIMESLAFTATGTMSNESTPSKSSKSLKMRKVILKRNPEVHLTPPEVSNYIQEPYKLYNDTSLPTHHHYHHHGYHQDPLMMDQPRPKVTRFFGNFFPGTEAVIESALSIHIPIPFCQFENSPCKIYYPRLFRNSPIFTSTF